MCHQVYLHLQQSPLQPDFRKTTQNPTFIQVYAAASDHDGEEVEKFHEQFDIIAKIPQKNMLAVQNDGNAKVSPDACRHSADLS